MKRRNTKAISDEKRAELQSYLSAVRLAPLLTEHGITRGELNIFIRGNLTDQKKAEGARKILIYAKSEYLKKQEIHEMVNSL